MTGDIDLVGASALRETLDDAMAERPYRIEVDLIGATFFCCAGVAALLAARKATGGRLILIGAGDLVQKLFTVLGLTSAFERTEVAPVVTQHP